MLSSENESWFYDVSSTLLRGQYKYAKAIETTVLKKNGNYRSLKIVSFKDIVVQKAFFLVLSCIFEKRDCLKVCKEDKSSFSIMLHQHFNSRFNFQKKKTTNLNDLPLGFTKKRSVHSVMRTIRMS